MSQDFELIQPQGKPAYPILVEEWNYLKKRVCGIRDNSGIYHTIGSVLLGIAGSALIASMTLLYTNVEVSYSSLLEAILWLITLCFSICGGLSIFFSRTQRKTQNLATEDVIDQMKLIEQRYEIDDT